MSVYPLTKNLDWSIIYDPTTVRPEKEYRKCYKQGHWKNQCLLIPFDLYFCGACSKIASHISKDFQNPDENILINLKLVVKIWEILVVVMVEGLEKCRQNLETGIKGKKYHVLNQR